MPPHWRSLSRADGTTFRAFRLSLEPRYGLVWLQIAGLQATLAVGLIGLATIPHGLARNLAVLPLGALWVGYWMASVQLYFHEAAHYLLARSRSLNDLLANVFIGSWIGQHIAVYRPIHFLHHRNLGTTLDPERSYFEALTPRLLSGALTGAKVWQVLAVRRAARANADGPPPVPWPLGLGLAAHGVVVGGLGFGLGDPFLAGAWVAGIGVVYPFFAVLRQLLEHRAVEADSETDYTKVDHGSVNRMFGTGPLASTFGAAGFNRHYLHHLEPQVPCTRLGQLEAFLAETSFRDELEARRTSYVATLLELAKPS